MDLGLEGRGRTDRWNQWEQCSGTGRGCSQGDSGSPSTAGPHDCGRPGASLPGLRLLVKDASQHGLYSEVSFRNLSSFRFFSNLAFTFSQKSPARPGTLRVYLPGCLLMALDEVVGVWVMQLVHGAEGSCLCFFSNVPV